MFSLSVDLPPVMARATVAEAAPADLPLAGSRVLVAEDHPVNQKVVALILGKAGARLRIVGDGAQALDAFEAEPFDLVLMDAHMPELDGASTIREMRAQEASAGLDRTPILMLTADARREPRAAALKAGADGVIVKPIRAAELLSAVSGALSGEAQPRAA